MIHTILVAGDVEPATLKKEFRKRLMTGGAVVRLCEGATENDARCLFEKFEAEAKRYNLAALVLEEVARMKGLPSELKVSLLSLEIPEVSRHLD